MGFFTLDKAIFYDEGLEVGKKFIPTIFFKKTFNYKERSFAVDLRLITKDGYLFTFKKWGLIWNTQHYIYEFGHIFPLRIKYQEIQIPAVDTDFLNTQLTNKVARDLNRLSDKPISALLTTKNLIIGGIALFILYLFFTGKWKVLIGN